MDKDLRDLLGDELKSQIEDLKKLKNGSPEHTAAVESISKLYKALTEDIKTSEEIRIKEEQSNDEWKLKTNDMSKQKTIKICELALQALGVVGSLVFDSIWMNRGFRFEETGTIMSKTFMTLFNRLNKKR